MVAVGLAGALPAAGAVAGWPGALARAEPSAAVPAGLAMAWVVVAAALWAVRTRRFLFAASLAAASAVLGLGGVAGLLEFGRAGALVTLASLALLLQSLVFRSLASGIVGVAGSCLTAAGIGLLPLAVLEVAPATPLAAALALPAPAAAGALFSGLALVGLGWGDRSRSPGGPRWLPVLVGLSILAGAFAIRQTIEHRHTYQLRHTLGVRLELAVQHTRRQVEEADAGRTPAAAPAAAVARVLEYHEGPDVSFRVIDAAGGDVYRSPTTAVDRPGLVPPALAVAVGGATWTIEARPTPALLSAPQPLPPNGVLVLGAIVALALAAAVALGQTVLLRAAIAQRTSQQLLDALVERNIARDTLERREALLQTVLETMGEGVLAVSATGEYLLFNRAARDLLGADSDDGPPTLDWDLMVAAADPGVWPAGQHTLSRGLRGEPIDDLDICLRRGEGVEPRWVSVFARPLALPSGVNGSMLVLRDVTERRLAQERVTQAARELERSNRELTEFAAVASHDLRAPLRSVSSFVALLDEEYGGSFAVEGRMYVARIRAAVARMGTLIDGLLALARVRAKGDPFVMVDLGEVAQEVVADIEGAIIESGAAVEVAELPVVEADRLQMRQLLQNLMSNAIKFRRPDVTPRVRVDAVQRTQAETGGEPMWELRVADNGIGLDPAHADRIFKPFERLHAQTAFEGSGLGLAVCARIVERHGGRIRVEHTAGQGATFIVSLPAARRRLEAA